MPTPLIARYAIGSANWPVKLTVEVGHAQQARTTVSLDGTPLPVFRLPVGSSSARPSSQAGDFALTIADAQQLLGRRLSICSAIERVQEYESQTSLTITLRGGATTRIYEMTDRISEKGGWLSYVAIITFTA